MDYKKHFLWHSVRKDLYREKAYSLRMRLLGHYGIKMGTCKHAAKFKTFPKTIDDLPF